MSLRESNQLDMPSSLSATVLDEVEILFGGADIPAVCELLGEYGEGPHEREVERVQLDILRLCKRDVERVRTLVQAARKDYRDILTWAEYQRFRVYIVWLLRKGPNWTAQPAAAAIARAHADAIGKMKEAGKLLIGGPLQDEEASWMYLFLVDSMEEARTLAEADPAVQSGHFSSTLRPWMAVEGLRVLPLKDLPY